MTSLDNVGTVIDSIPVEISYKIIELFSAGLYSSPNKAFEELVSNSYDAGATKVSVYVPLDKTLSDSILWVADNGTSMDKDGLKQFWKIGSSNKRDAENLERLPIGKFGIGKLATYILTNKLTLICKAIDGKYYAVTMNYSTINKDSTETISLDEKELTLDEVKTILSPLIKKGSQDLLTFKLWDDNCEKTWTFAILSDLKAKASEIKDGRLKWILSTALPLNPNFNLSFNGSLIQSSKENITPWKTWVFGEDDDVAKNPKYNYEVGEYKENPCVHLPNLRNVVGKIDLYRDSLLTGKSEELGRSNGIFLTVRDRLINIDDPLIGMEALSHGVFNRVRISVNADELDDYITSTRESIKSSSALEDLREYIKRKFSQTKDWYFATIEAEEKQNRASHKIAYASASLSRRPLIVVAKKFLEGELTDLVLTDIPNNLSAQEKTDLITRLENDLTTDKGIIQKVEWVTLNPEDPIAKFEMMTGFAKINLMHPFFANFLDEVKSLLPFQLIALTEILTECFLLDSGISQDEVKDIMFKRDAILRELTFSDKPNAPFVASLLNASLGDSSGLEKSVAQAFNSLGYECTPIGGKGTPDGKAVAYLGPINSPENYSITYDAKSTAKDKIKATTAHISGVDRHRDDYKANYACVVAIDYEGASDPNSAVNKEAKKHKINLIKASDLMVLVLLSSPKQVGLKELKDFFENCHTVIETTAWIEALKSKQVTRGPIKELLEEAFSYIKSDTEQPNLYALRERNQELKKHSVDSLKTLVQSIERLVPNYISISHDNIVNLNVPPDKILNAINQAFATDVPVEFRDIYVNAFSSNKQD
ncbi:MAG: ATP-binding protein [Bacteroidia bacterium]|nr:ATP-binding protein [Bacteroidia bacterium]